MTFCHIKDPDNIGDQLCCPQSYFPEFASHPVVDIRDRVECPTIFGGGGLLHEGVEEVIKQADRRSILWGVGSNYHDPLSPAYPEWLWRFAFVGLRDYGNPWNYVPCVSCLRPEFDVEFGPPTHEAVVYEHHQHPLNIDLPKKNNRGTHHDFADVIRFLASSKVVLTNTYHGAYWASLLGVPVVIINAFSSRFHHLKPGVAYASETNWQEAVSATRPMVGYLQECRERNQRMFRKVIEIINRP